MKKSKIIWGLVILIIALVVWLGNMQMIAVDMKRDWPVIFIIIGIILIYRGFRFKTRHKKVIVKDKTVDIVLDDLENGKINAKEAISKIKKEDKRNEPRKGKNIKNG